jgi:hypothetical protein
MNAAGLWLRRIALALMLVLLGLAVLTARVVYDGEREMRLSDEAFNRGDVHTATLYARRAAVLYAPGAPHVGPAYARLIAIAEGAEAAGDRVIATRAWGAVRGAALETRHLWAVRSAELERANQNLARLESSAGPSRSAEPGKALQEALSRLHRHDAPRAPWVAVLVVGFVLAAVGLGLVGWRGISADGRIVLQNAKLGLLLAIVGAACWTIAAYRA